MIGATVNSIQAAVQIQSPAAPPAQVTETGTPELERAGGQPAPHDSQSPQSEDSPEAATPRLAAYGATGRLVAQAPPRGISILA
jgi:hypothetical protein